MRFIKVSYNTTSSLGFCGHTELPNHVLCNHIQELSKAEYALDMSPIHHTETNDHYSHSRTNYSHTLRKEFQQNLNTLLWQLFSYTLLHWLNAQDELTNTKLLTKENIKAEKLPRMLEHQIQGRRQTVFDITWAKLLTLINTHGLFLLKTGCNK